MLGAFSDFRDDPKILVCIVTGAGKRSFCAGSDLKYIAQHGNKSDSSLYGLGLGGITSDFTCHKPIIAAVNGYAIGGGLEIALACDIIIASDNAEFGLPEPRVGLIPGAGGIHRLTRQIPLKLAMGMLLTGKNITATEAHRMGFVNEVVPLAILMSTAEAWANEIMKCAPLSTRAIKQISMSALDRPLDIAMKSNYSEHEKAKASDDWLEGPRAFAEKRNPKWIEDSNA
jgi:crotonobetainyl-CoA hydratase